MKAEQIGKVFQEAIDSLGEQKEDWHEMLSVVTIPYVSHSVSYQPSTKEGDALLSRVKDDIAKCVDDSFNHYNHIVHKFAEDAPIITPQYLVVHDQFITNFGRVSLEATTWEMYRLLSEDLPVRNVLMDASADSLARTVAMEMALYDNQLADVYFFVHRWKTGNPLTGSCDSWNMNQFVRSVMV